MSEPSVHRTLVKSPPELWAEVSDEEALSRHLDAFGEIRITRLEPETTVVWEGDRASGTVSLEASGWGTKVTLTAELRALEEALEEPVAVVEEPVVQEPPPPPPPEPPEPVAAVAAVAPPPPGFFARLFRRSAPVAPPPEPAAVIEEEVAPEPVAAEPVVVVEEEPAPAEPPLAPEDAQQALTSALDSLGAAHHRPFSRG